MILDVGPDTLKRLAGRFETAKTVVWNGPLGAFEVPPFDRGTAEAARLVAMRSKQGELSAGCLRRRHVGGGAQTKRGAADDFTRRIRFQRAAPSSNGWKAVQNWRASRRWREAEPKGENWENDETTGDP